MNMSKAGSNSQVAKRQLSCRGLNLALKAVLSREVRAEGKVASAAVAARINGEHAKFNGQARHAQRKELRGALRRAARPEVIYGNAVKEANMRCVAKSKSFVPSR